MVNLQTVAQQKIIKTEKDGDLVRFTVSSDTGQRFLSVSAYEYGNSEGVSVSVDGLFEIATPLEIEQVKKMFFLESEQDEVTKSTSVSGTTIYLQRDVKH